MTAPEPMTPERRVRIDEYLVHIGEYDRTLGDVFLGEALAEVDRLRARAGAVRVLHPREVHADRVVCGSCRDTSEEPLPYPCPTVRALDGDRLIQVTIRVRAAEARWGSGLTRPVVRTFEISDRCPACGGERGTPTSVRQHDDGETYYVDVWNNPCGHTDHYEDVAREATAIGEQQDGGAE